MSARRANDKRKDERITFERGLPVHMLGIDGSWTRACTLDDISETGARLTLSAPPDEAAIKEFFLVLSSQGLVYRRCELIWVIGHDIGVNFIVPDNRKGIALRSPDSRDGSSVA